MTTNADLQALHHQAVPRGVASVASVYAERARNAEVWDVEGQRYIDFASGIAVVNTGHCHPRVVAAVEAQLRKYSHTCFQVVPYEPYVRLADRLNRLVPGDTPKKTLFLTTGAEAVENAVKIARAYTGRPGILSFGGGFHGRTMMALALTGKVVPYKAGFAPFPPEVYHLPFPNRYHGIEVEAVFATLERLFKVDIEPERVAAVIIEPVQGEGGFHIAPPNFLGRLRQICDNYGILFIADEIQTGFARTGRMFAIEHAGIEADLMTLAKSLGGGFPISAVTGKAEIMDAVLPGGLGGTYGGPPLGCAAGLAVLDVIEEEGLIERANKIGALMVGRLEDMKRNDPANAIGDIRRLGAMVAMELVKGSSPDQPDAELTKALVQETGRRGLILLACGTRGNVIRFLVPLTASDALIHEGMDILAETFADLSALRDD